MASFLDIVGKKTTHESKSDPNQLNVQDLEYLLTSLKTITLRGDQVEQFYNLVIKLQNQYIALTNKK